MTDTKTKTQKCNRCKNELPMVEFKMKRTAKHFKTCESCKDKVRTWQQNRIVKKSRMIILPQVLQDIIVEYAVSSCIYCQRDTQYEVSLEGRFKDRPVCFMCACVFQIYHPDVRYYESGKRLARSDTPMIYGQVRVGNTFRYKEGIVMHHLRVEDESRARLELVKKTAAV